MAQVYKGGYVSLRALQAEIPSQQKLSGPPAARQAAIQRPELGCR